MTFEKFNLLNEKLINKLNEDAKTVRLMEEEKYNDGMSSSTQTYDQSKNITNTLALQKNTAENEKIEARDKFRIAKYNPMADDRSIRLAKRNYEKAITDYKKADLKKSNYKYLQNLKKDTTQVKESYVFTKEDLLLAEEFDKDLLAESTAKDIEFANNQIERVNNAKKDLQNETSETTDELENNLKQAVSNSKIEQKSSVSALVDKLNKQQEQIQKQNEKKIEQIKKNEELKMKTLDRKLEKLKAVKSTLKTQLTNNNQNNSSGEESQEE